MNKKLKYYENLGLIVSILKNEYPKKISKAFSDKIMNNIYSNSNYPYKLFRFNSLVKVASVFIFAVITVYVLQFSDNQINYTGTTVNKEFSHPIKNVINKTDDCKENNNSSLDDNSKKCD